ncbi:hypothetical protein B1A74_08380 [Thioalkalivibrio halophilus]|uniref:Integrase DNA-binding domain-containing protein n=1 Tax=Thioalkalivibrio halophilus TaxID=252474 RepID=A0A1V2ZXR3_9GAMM|nr:hypothetical protein B1A74_08380 [Thioalkalivibrio halophilus]
MPKPTNKLTAAALAAAKYEGRPRKLFDGGGLYVPIQASGRYWRPYRSRLSKSLSIRLRSCRKTQHGFRKVTFLVIALVVAVLSFVHSFPSICLWPRSSLSGRMLAVPVGRPDCACPCPVGALMSLPDMRHLFERISP